MSNTNEEKQTTAIPPIFGIELDSKDVSAFSTLENACKWIEPYDVDEWEAYDSEGRVIDIILVKDASVFGIEIGPGKVKLFPSTSFEQAKLAAYIAAYLSVVG